jgi:hypothetical protein
MVLLIVPSFSPLGIERRLEASSLLCQRNVSQESELYHRTDEMAISREIIFLDMTMKIGHESLPFTQMAHT